MSQEHVLSSGSDEDDDEDYVPEGKDCESVSEVDSEGDAESAPEDENDENRIISIRGKSKKLNTRVKSKKARKKKFIGKDSPETPEVNDVPDKKILTEEEEKKKADLLWADFTKDAGTVSKAKAVKPSNANRSISPVMGPKTEEKVKITKIFEFAGEEVKVEKEVSVDSAEARLSLSSVEKPMNEPESSMKALPSARGAKRTGLAGLSSVLGQLGKKAKISTLEKSKLDWDSFKREEKLDEEINTHNRGKDGYLERQDFLQRADVRRFEIEKQMRLSRRGTR